VTPLVWGVYDQLGRTAHFIKVDACELAAEQEELTYCQLQQRALLARQASPRAGGGGGGATLEPWARGPQQHHAGFSCALQQSH
jgi:hypothetical protein